MLKNIVVLRCLRGVPPAILHHLVNFTTICLYRVFYGLSLIIQNISGELLLV